MDWLSFSPSLVDVLSLVDYKDIANCAQVNQRVHDVILKSRKTMPRPLADITIRFGDDEKGTNEVVIEMENNEKMNKFAVTWRLLEFIDCGSPWILEQYKRENNIPKWKEFAIRNVYRCKGKVQAAFITKGLKEGLTQILSFIFQRFHIDWIYMKAYYSIPSLELCQLAADALSSSLADCRQLTLDTRSMRWPSPDSWIEISKLFDCTVLSWMTSLERLKHLIPLIYNWKRDVYFDLCEPLRVESLPPIVDVIRKWQSGSINFGYLQIAPRRAPDALDHLLGGPLLSLEDISTAVDSLKFSEELLKPDGACREVLRFLFKRTHDDKILSLTYSALLQRLQLREYKH